MYKYLIVLNILCALLLSSVAHGQTCHYQDWHWNVKQKRVVELRNVVKDYAMLTPDEVDTQSGCSVCVEDQQVIRLSGLPEFSVCKRYAPMVRDALERLIGQGEKINSVIAYRVGRTRGDIDARGNRTGFSNHSYGVAIDINAGHNGLYENCPQFGAHCKLVHGGPWRPQHDPFSLHREGNIVKAFTHAGFKWGGEIQGKQKDFMHFSLTGY
ncbi:MAG: hypothetical protein B7Y56_06740 [Gallionellales bacterium 35-53-114]|jgi:hypothetical protein|nr:MAG: hypothetical protein B7Y56_06740 [Gallionellales bacterium 35-53-114]OYZ63890.1 MAG: hypothetical protein B7Y04_07835 [Gallionellales bacterium 24-53-125]OZB09279.1 MAG: hypothetical protein B7X61_06375 [Gallionellales bacterium 39-52-133]HQS59109.1 M15 family metallopeptidase [Gallionellaceae bacterium]HQS75845.1 M15 family metallopeptidase [Gallionellaceae bacterium]